MPCMPRPNNEAKKIATAVLGLKTDEKASKTEKQSTSK